MTKNPEVFPGKSFQDTLKDIYDNTAAKREQIETMMGALAGVISGSAQNAAIVAPIWKELLEVSVKNDEHIVKVATIIQRLMSSELQNVGGEGLDSMLSDEEKNKLLLEAENASLNELDAALKETEQLRLVKQTAAAIVSGSTPNAP